MSDSTPLTDDQLAELLTTLRDQRVDHIVIGGVAAHAHGAERQPHDLDIVVRSTWVNLEATARALRALDAQLPDYRQWLGDHVDVIPDLHIDAATLARTPISSWQTRTGRLDVFDAVTSLNGHDLHYDRLAARAEILRPAGVPVAVAGLDDVIATKLYAGRPKDLAVVGQLQRHTPTHGRHTPTGPAHEVVRRPVGIER